MVRLTGDELAAFKAIMPLGDESSPSRAPSLLLLTEAGMNLVLILSRQPKAAAIQDWLAEEVMPQLSRDGRYDPSRKVEGPRVVESEPPPAHDPLLDLRQRVSMARDLLAELPDERRTVAAEALLRVVVPGLDLPPPSPPRGHTSPTAPERASATDLLGDVVAWARAHRARLWPEAPHMRGALGMWSEGEDLFLTREALEAALGRQPARALLLAWVASGALIRQDSGHLTVRVRISVARIRCYRFAAAVIGKL